jgi:molybdate-binding protein/DNA-binding transcriptional regulator YhcF (GntR family)
LNKFVYLWYYLSFTSSALNEYNKLTMTQIPLYQKIISAVRQDIFTGRYRPGDRLPSIRAMTEEWSCTPGTVQRAYHELVEQGLVISRPGKGTHVVQVRSVSDGTPLRRASLVNRAQSFLLEALTAGYSPEEVETAIRLALDEWRVVNEEEHPPVAGKLRFTGSHDLALAWIAAHFSEIVPGYTLELHFTGSLGGLIALAEGKADLAGCHLWDQESDSYNFPFVRRLLPGRRVLLLSLAWRRQGLIAPPGNPKDLHQLADLQRSGLRFANRQPGSGTRVWLDAALHTAGIPSEKIQGYAQVLHTHSEVARAVAEGRADVGFGAETAARAFGLAFEPLLSERYDLVIPGNCAHFQAVEQLADWLASETAHQAISELGGYDTKETGNLIWIE